MHFMSGLVLNNRVNLTLLTLSILSLTFYTVFDWSEITFVLIHILSFGYLHGATDRVIYFAEEKHQKTRYQLFFLATYLSIIAISLIFWSIFPGLMLPIFLIYSSYHFGETHLEQAAISGKFRKLIHFLWGAFILMGILLLNTSVVLEIIGLDRLKQHAVFLNSLGHFCFLSAGIVIITMAFQAKQYVSTIIEMVVLFFLYQVVLRFPLMVSFTLFFVYWHSIKSLVHQYIYLQTTGGKKLLVKGYKEILITGIFPLLVGVMLYFSFLADAMDFKTVNWEGWIIALSASLSLPHVVLHGYKIYARRKLDG